MKASKNIYLLQNQHIYITNSEENKNGDWCIVDGGLNRIGIDQFQSNVRYSVDPKKIILTTDPDLINYGVQAIDDAFLWWFLKNPSCEFVEVYKVGAKLFAEPIIPKEAPKQETVEQAAENRYTPGVYVINGIDICEASRECFIEGAKWQAKRSYSEEDIIEFAKFCNLKNDAAVRELLIIWCNKYRKK
jgi:hypothetical protein